MTGDKVTDVVTTEGEKVVDTDNKDNPQVPSYRLREKEEAHLKQVAELEAKHESEKESLAERVKQLEYENLVTKYGEEVVNDPKVQELREKHGTLEWDEVIRLAGKEPKKSSYGAPIGRTPTNITSADPSVVTGSWIAEQPFDVRKSYRDKAKKGEVRIDYDS